jgi:hypothetical protein
MRRYVIAVLMSTAGLLASDATALAQNATFGGGRFASIERSRAYRPTVGMTVQPRGDRISLRFSTTVLCGRISHDVGGIAEIPWNGSTYAAEGVGRVRLERGRVDFAWEIRGTVMGAASDGILRVVGRQVVGGRTTACTKRPVRAYQTRAPFSRTGMGSGPEPGGAYLGTTDTIVTDDLPGPVALRISKDGRRVGGRWEASAACGSGPREIFTNFTPSSYVRPDGSFYRAERFAQRFSDAFVRYQVRFSGRFTSEGAWGTLYLRTAVYDRTGKKLRTRCDSGVRNWTAMRASLVQGSPPHPTR